MFSVTGHGTFADGPVASTWLFTMQGDTLANAGVLAQDDQVDPFVLVDGRGTPFSVHGAIPRGCTTSGLRDLRAASASDRPVHYASDAGMLLALRYRTAPARACKGTLVQGQRTVTSMLLDELDPEHGTWSTRTTQAVPVPAGACRTTYPLAVDLRRDRAAVALVTCTIVDAQDSVSIQSCQLTLHAWQGGVWTFASAPRVLDSVPLDVRVSSNPARMTVYGDESSQLFRSEDGMLRSEGEVPGGVLSLDGDRMVVGEIGGSRKSSSGIPWRLRAYQRVDGRWTAGATSIDVAGVRELSVAWRDDGAVVVAPEDIADQNPVRARVLRLRGDRWSEVGIVNAMVTRDDR